jgi:hypothetical protein
VHFASSPNGDGQAAPGPAELLQRLAPPSVYASPQVWNENR